MWEKHFSQSHKNVQELFGEFQVGINKIQGFKNIEWEYSVFFIFLDDIKVRNMSNAMDNKIKI